MEEEPVDFVYARVPFPGGGSKGREGVSLSVRPLLREGSVQGGEVEG